MNKEFKNEKGEIKTKIYYFALKVTQGKMIVHKHTREQLLRAEVNKLNKNQIVKLSQEINDKYERKKMQKKMPDEFEF